MRTQTAVGWGWGAIACASLAAACAISAPPTPAPEIIATSRQDGRWPPVQDRIVPNAIVNTAAVRGGTIQGVVLNSMDGMPLEYADVIVDSADLRTRTNRLGLFRLPGLRGVHRLRIQSIGFRPFTAEVNFNVEHGYVGRFGLDPAFVVTCWDFPVGEVPTVAVALRDAMTGMAPVGEVSLEATDGAFRQATSATAAAGDTVLNVRVGPWRSGRYRVKVAAKDYMGWEREDVRVGRNECGSMQIVGFLLWLLPTGNIIALDSVRNPQD